MYGSAGPTAAYQADRPAQVVQGLDLREVLPDYDWDEEEVKNAVQDELDHALGREGGQLSSERLQAQKYFEGAPLGNEVEGRSTIVLRTVMEAVEWVLPALLRIFTASRSEEHTSELQSHDNLVCRL